MLTSNEARVIYKTGEGCAEIENVRQLEEHNERIGQEA